MIAGQIKHTSDPGKRLLEASNPRDLRLARLGKLPFVQRPFRNESAPLWPTSPQRQGQLENYFARRLVMVFAGLDKPVALVKTAPYNVLCKNLDT